MKTQFRHQVTELDCTPTSIINALSYLFERKEIPPAVIQRIYLYCLDGISSKKEHGYGTSYESAKLIAHWLSEFTSYQYKEFRVDAQYIEQDEAHLGPRNKLKKCLDQGGVAVVGVTLGNDAHDILALEIKENWLYAFDPYPQTTSANKAGNYEYLVPQSGQSPNLRIHLDWLNTQSNKKNFRLGSKSERFYILLNRIQP